MERDDHGGGLKQQQQPPAAAAWTPGHNFSLASGCFSSWPVPPPSSSSYTCGYCRREFRSAQALGGHMNVHRRDRARLRQCYPSHLIAAAHHHHRRAAAAAPPLPNLNFLPPHCAGDTTTEPVPVVYSFLSTSATAAVKAAVGVNLDLGIGGGICGDAAEDGGLDLELRLGCSWE
jgi:hypothetical protein